MSVHGLTKGQLIEVVSDLTTTPNSPHNQTSLVDWVTDGDTDDMTPQQIANEWDELEEMETDL